jgi:hypothetical protein
MIKKQQGERRGVSRHAPKSARPRGVVERQGSQLTGMGWLR